MFGLIAGGIVLTIIYFLLVNGYLWKCICWFFAFFGMHYFLSNYIQSSNHTLLTAGTFTISWAIVIPLVIVLLAMGHTRESDL